MYAGVAAWYSLLEYKVFFRQHHTLMLIDRAPRPIEFIPLLESITPTNQIHWLDAQPPTLFKAAVLGLSRDALVAETHVERGKEFRFRLRSFAFRTFCGAVRDAVIGRREVTAVAPTDSDVDSGQSERARQEGVWTWMKRRWVSPSVTLILRDGYTRKIANEGQVINLLKSLPIRLSVHKFVSSSLFKSHLDAKYMGIIF
jgi:hypothetical protein